jgi:hypothetical protein
MRKRQAHAIQLTLLVQLVCNPLGFFCALFTRFVVHNETVGWRQKRSGPLSSRIESSQRHRVDSAADCETCMLQSVMF